MGGIVTKLIEDYINERNEKLRELPLKENLNEIMRMSEVSFVEWDNDEDEVYNDL